jgi:opacity protein-like surface antigen
VQPEREPYARANRLAVSLGFGFGSASLSRLHDLVDGAVRGAEGPKSGLQINAELSVRYYFPYYVLAEVGYGALYNRAHQDYGLARVDSDNLLMEVPILVGGYYPFIKRLYVHGGVGPSVFFFPRAFFDPNAPDFKADTGVGLHVVAGADFLVTEHFAAGLELRYRYLKTGDLKEVNSGVVLTSGVVRSDGSSETYNLDFSGVSLGLNLRLFAM